MIEGNMTTSGRAVPRHRYTCALDTMEEELRMGVYCGFCGRIVILDRLEMGVRMKLGKELECASCRNRRIYKEIEDLDNHFNGIVEPDPMLV